MLEEGLAVLAGLWSGEPFSFAGAHYRVRRARFLPTPVQLPRIPIWMGGTWPGRGPFRRAARWDGVFPHYREPSGAGATMPPQALREMVAWISARREGDAPFAVVLRGATPGDDPERAAAIVAPYVEAGLTWWLEGVAGMDGPRDPKAVRARIRQGPPRSHAAVPAR